MSDYDAVVSRADASALQSEERLNQIFQDVVEESVIMRLGTRLRNMNKHEMELPVINSLVEAYVLGASTAQSGETAVAKVSEQKWADTTLKAATIATVVPIPIAVFEDSDFDIWEQIRPRIVSAIGKKFDQLVFDRDTADVPTDWPLGIFQYCADNSKTVSLSDFEGADLDIYDAVFGTSGTLAKVEADGYMVNGHVGALSLRSKLRNARDANGRPLFVADPTGPVRYSLDGEPVFFPRNGSVNASNWLLMSGDFSQVVWSVRKDIQFKVQTSGVITDNSGLVQINLDQQRHIALHAYIRAGWALPNPPNQVKSSAQYPFAVLVP